MTSKKHPSFSPNRERLHEIIFESDTRAGKLFDVALLCTIVMLRIVSIVENN
jgi:voltage-gated potassium channel